MSSMLGVDREGLILKANGSYGIPKAEYERLMGFSLRGTETVKRGFNQSRPQFNSPQIQGKW